MDAPPFVEMICLRTLIPVLPRFAVAGKPQLLKIKVHEYQPQERASPRERPVCILSSGACLYARAAETTVGGSVLL